MPNLESLAKYRSKQKQARYYWGMTKCSAVKLAEYCGIALPQAGRWVRKFIKERGGP